MADDDYELKLNDEDVNRVTGCVLQSLEMNIRLKVPDSTPLEGLLVLAIALGRYCSQYKQEEKMGAERYWEIISKESAAFRHLFLMGYNFQEQVQADLKVSTKVETGN